MRRLFARFVRGALMLSLLTTAGYGQESSSTRLVPFGNISLPFLSPAWAGGDALAATRELLRETNADLGPFLERLLSQGAGELLYFKKPTRTSEWLRIGPAWEAWRGFLGTLEPESRTVFLAALSRYERTRSEPIESVSIGPGSEWLFSPAHREPARVLLALAWEKGQLDRVSLLTRSQQVDSPAAKRWLELTRREEVRAESSWQSTFPGDRRETPIESDVVALRKTGVVQLNYRKNPHYEQVFSKLKTRRSPIGAIFPLLNPTGAILYEDRRAYGIEFENSTIEWLVSADQLGVDRPDSREIHLESLIDPIVPVAFDRRVLVPFRSSRPKASNNSMIIYSGPKFREGLYRTAIFAIPERAGQVSPLGQRPNRQVRGGVIAAPNGEYTQCGPALAVRDLVVIPRSRGFLQNEISLWAFDRDSGSLRWSRTLGRADPQAFPAFDLREILPTVYLKAWAGELLVSHNLGWLSRVGIEDGSYRGAYLYPRYGLDDLPNRGKTSIQRIQFLGLAEPRLRNPGPSRVFERPGQGPLWVVLPPDSRHLLAINLDTWENEWPHQEAGRQEMVAGFVDQEVLLLNAEVLEGEWSIGLRRIDLEGRHRALASLKIRQVEKTSTNGPIGPFSPILVGAPRLVGRQIWVPTHTGLEIWELDQIDSSSAAPPARILPWPYLSEGGTPIPIDENRLITISRGFVEFFSQAELNIFRYQREH